MQIIYFTLQNLKNYFTKNERMYHCRTRINNTLQYNCDERSRGNGCRLILVTFLSYQVIMINVKADVAWK
jgi:hypothetical protein